MNRIGASSSVLFIIAIISTMAFADSTPTYASEIFEAEVILSPPTPSSVIVGTPVSATVNFGHDFSSIERICFIFNFQDDLLDPGELLSFFGPFGLNGAGFQNITPAPQGSRTICFTASLHPETISLFLDGEQDFGIQMEVGSVIIEVLTIQITGQDKINISIDIKPGSDPNCFNVDGNGVIPVAVLGSSDFDVTDIAVDTLSFAGLEVRVRGNDARQCSVEDVSGDFTTPEGAPDGYPDLVCQFVDDSTSWNPGDGTATLTGELLDGTPFEGMDSICIVP